MTDFAWTRKFDDFNLAVRGGPYAIPLVPLSRRTLRAYTAQAGKREKSWLKSLFTAGPGHCEERQDGEGGINKTVIAMESCDDEVKDPYDCHYALAGWAQDLRPATYELTDKIALTPGQKYNLLLGWGLGSYAFDKYKSPKNRTRRNTRLVIPPGVDKKRLRRELAATYMVQDLINEPQNVMSPEGLTKAALSLAAAFGAAASVAKGEDLRPDRENYPLVHAVGKGAEEEPRVVDILWGDPKHPAITLVGKGVTFDEGGVNNKDSDQMRNMKNDMAGAAHALGLAFMIMDAKLPVRLRVLLPVVDNAAGNRSYRQGDVLDTRKGEKLETVNTDAEGRLILSDALFEAAHPAAPGQKPPALIVDFGTLSWFGHLEYPGFGSVFASRAGTQKEFMEAASACQEYFAPRPLMRRLFRELKEGAVADLRQCSDDHKEYDDLLAAALLHHHVGDEADWLHLDLQSWREGNTARTQYPPHLPAGGFAMGMRSAFHLIEKRYGGPRPA